jgi:hypothetical protein
MHFPSLIDVLALCNYCIMANVLDYNTYQFPLSKGCKPTPHQLRLRARYDYSALTPVKRQYFTYIRGIALNFIRWINCNFDVIPSKARQPPQKTPDTALGGIMCVYMSELAYCILHYKKKAEAQKVQGIPNCKAADVLRQLELLFYNNENIPNQMDFNADTSSYDCFAFTDYSWSVVKKATPTPFLGIWKCLLTSLCWTNIQFTEKDPHTMGTTRGDTMFMEGLETAFPSYKGSDVSKPAVSEDSSPESEEDGKGVGKLVVSLKRKRGD